LQHLGHHLVGNALLGFGVFALLVAVGMGMARRDGC
jgi:hypothetical protein